MTLFPDFSLFCVFWDLFDDIGYNKIILWDCCFVTQKRFSWFQSWKPEAFWCLVSVHCSYVLQLSWMHVDFSCSFFLPLTSPHWYKKYSIAMTGSGSCSGCTDSINWHWEATAMLVYGLSIMSRLACLLWPEKLGDAPVAFYIEFPFRSPEKLLVWQIYLVDVNTASITDKWCERTHSPSLCSLSLLFSLSVFALLLPLICVGLWKNFWLLLAFGERVCGSFLSCAESLNVDVGTAVWLAWVVGDRWKGQSSSTSLTQEFMDFVSPLPVG